MRCRWSSQVVPGMLSSLELLPRPAARKGRSGLRLLVRLLATSSAAVSRTGVDAAFSWSWGRAGGGVAERDESESMPDASDGGGRGGDIFDSEWSSLASTCCGRDEALDSDGGLRRSSAAVGCSSASADLVKGVIDLGLQFDRCGLLWSLDRMPSVGQNVIVLVGVSGV